MNKKSALLVMCISGFCIARAQDYTRPITETPPGVREPTKFSLSISAGPAIPMGDFGSKTVKGSFWDFNSPDSVRLQGFAKTGFHFDLSLAYAVSDNVSIMAMIGGNFNPIDVTGFSSAVGYPGTSSSTSYYTGEYLIGPSFTIPAGRKFKFILTAMIGIASNTYPSFTVNLNDTLTDTRDIAPGKNALCYNLSIGLTYSLTDNIDLLFNAAYMGATFKYPSWTDTYNATSTNPNYYYLPLSLQHPNDETQMATGILKPSIGVVFRF